MRRSRGGGGLWPVPVGPGLWVMDDGDEVDVVILNNSLKGLDELPSWSDGFSPHSCP